MHLYMFGKASYRALNFVLQLIAFRFSNPEKLFFKNIYWNNMTTFMHQWLNTECSMLGNDQDNECSIWVAV